MLGNCQMTNSLTAKWEAKLKRSTEPMINLFDDGCATSRDQILLASSLRHGQADCLMDLALTDINKLVADFQKKCNPL